MTTTKTFNMQFIRYMNLFSRVTQVSASHCFLYNNTIVFVVPQPMIMQAIGRDNSNLRKLSGILTKRIRIVPQPRGEQDLMRFVSVLVDPIKFEKIEILDNEKTKEKEIVITTGGRESKAMLIGRARARETELKDILEQHFGVKNLRIA